MAGAVSCLAADMVVTPGISLAVCLSPPLAVPLMSRLIVVSVASWLILGVVDESVFEDSECFEVRLMLWPSADDGLVDS